MNIDRCLCSGHTFAVVLERARTEGWDLDGVRRELGVGANCGLCRAYLRRTFATGETIFHSIIIDDDAQR